MVAFLVFIFTTIIAVTFGAHFRLRGKTIWTISDNELLLRVLVSFTISTVLNICFWRPAALAVVIVVAVTVAALYGCMRLTAWLTKRYLK